MSSSSSADASGRSTPQPSQPARSLAPVASVTQVVAPQVRIINGEIVLDEDTLLNTPAVEGACLPMDVVHDTGRHLTSHAFVTRMGSNRWKKDDTDLFYDALSMCGTDFSLMSMLFPSRTREQLKGKYKIEERCNPARVGKCLRTKKPFDVAWLERVQASTKMKESPRKRGRPSSRAF